MGKTKTAVISGSVKEEKTSQEKYAEKMAKRRSEKPDEKIEKSKTIKAARGKKYQDAKTKIDKNKSYSLAEAIKLIKEIKFAKFDETFELHLSTKKHPLSTQVTLPHSFGEEKKVAVANQTTLSELEKGEINFDVLLATPEMMPKIAKFARILGPKGLMPNPKNGTIIKNEKDAKKFSANSLTLKTEKSVPLIHTSFGKVSMDNKKLVENANAIFKAIGPKQVTKAYLKSSMSPSVKINI